MLTDLATHVNDTVYLYSKGGHSWSGTLLSVDASGVTKLDTGFVTVEVLSSEIEGYGV